MSKLIAVSVLCFFFQCRQSVSHLPLFFCGFSAAGDYNNTQVTTMYANSVNKYLIIDF